MTTRFLPPNTPALDDVAAEQVRRIHESKLLEIQGSPILQIRVLPGVVLANAVETQLSHGLGRAPFGIWVSPIIGAPPGVGLIEEVRGVFANGNPIDRSRFIVLIARAYTVAVTVDVMVF